MKKKITLIATAVLLICCLFVSGCSDPYTSSYKAVGFAHSNTDASASMSFSEFTGTKVFKLYFPDSFDKSLNYSLRLESGSITIYYDTDGTKTQLVSLTSNSNVKDTLEDLKCDSMYIIVESSGKCLNGNFSFDVKVL